MRKPKSLSGLLAKSYKWKAGAGEFKGYDAALIFGALEGVRKVYGELKPQHIVEAARSDDSPLHDIFPWDDVRAAQIGREAIAARLVRSLHVTIVTPDRGSIDTRAFTSRRDKEATGGRSYIVTSSALDDEDGRAMLIRQAWAQLHAWRRRFADLNELAQVFDLIDRADAEQARQGRAG